MEWKGWGGHLSTCLSSILISVTWWLSGLSSSLGVWMDGVASCSIVRGFWDRVRRSIFAQ